MTRPLIALTGASGFTGAALLNQLVEEGFPVRALVRQSTAPRPAVEFVQGALDDPRAHEVLMAGVDCVVHIAAMYRNEGSLEEFMRINHDATVALLNAAQAAGVRRFIYCSTIGVHGTLAQTPGDETAPFNPRDPYQVSKLAAEEACRAQIGKSDTEIVIIRPCGIYGPGDTRMLKMFKMIDRGQFFFIGDGAPNFHPVYIDDLVQGFLRAIVRPEASGETFIIGAAKYTPLSDYVAAAAGALGRSPPRLRIPYAPMNLLARACELAFKPLRMQPPLHQRRLTFFKHNRAFSIAKAQRLLGYDPQFDLDEGFRRTVAWYRQQGLLPAAAPTTPGAA